MRQFCDICSRHVLNPQNEDSQRSIGKSVNVCYRCQDDILKSTRLVNSHNAAIEKTNDLKEVRKMIDPEFFAKSQLNPKLA